jgi:hypothetical protein
MAVLYELFWERASPSGAQYRMSLLWTPVGAENVEIVDYH